MAMMGGKIGTKAFQEIRPNQVQGNAAEQSLTQAQLQQLGAENLGEVLNKVADPNYIDPAKRMRTVGNDKLDKDAFMKLMLAQMKNQDPTNPLKSHEMAAQLAQFSSLEQLQNVNTNLEQLKMAQKPTETYQSLNFIGKAVSGDSSKISRVKGDVNHDFNFELPDDAQKVSIIVKDANGEQVRRVDLNNLKRGPNSWRWNGESDRGEVKSSGDYRFAIEANTSQGQKLDVKTDFEGIISGVNYTAEGPILMIGNQSVKLSDVKQIVDPAKLVQDQYNDQNSKIQTSGPLNLSKQIGENKNTEVQNSKGAPDADDKPVGNVMTGLAMSPDFMEKLQKETK